MKIFESVHYIRLKVYRHRRRAVCFGCAAVTLALLLMMKCEIGMRFVSEMENTEPQDIWEYVSDFSRMMDLNPTITTFTITHESTNYKQWNYTVVYKEYLSQLPFVTNTIVGDFVIDKLQSRSKHRTIKSTHRTCFAKIYCLNTKSEMIFLENPNGTKIVEEIKYECPWLLTRFCKNEVTYQREKIFGHLRTVFVHTKR
ncbi:Hypothetical protein CINCED_3A018094 [Cinara cedri]|uniref:Uncharacterized protein n=1 Tax=Cinara cedri TaxID=506608 RepID=A0A5E4MD41_9HEMI|nr:Hypothetical protein CINCED_3A018094 [Cinara cedri]